MLNDTQKQAIGEIFSEAPEQLLEEFINIIDIYKKAEAKLTDPSISMEARSNARLSYINNVYNHVNLIIKYIAISANSFSMVSSVAPANTIQQHIQEKTNNPQVDDDGLEVMDADELMGSSDAAPVESKKEENNNTINLSDILSSEIELWGIKKDSYSYNILMAIKDVGDPDDITKYSGPYEYIIEQVTDILGSHKGVVSAGYGKIVNNAKFENGKYFTDLKGAKKEEIVCSIWEFSRLAKQKFGGK